MRRIRGCALVLFVLSAACSSKVAHRSAPQQRSPNDPTPAGSDQGTDPQDPTEQGDDGGVVSLDAGGGDHDGGGGGGATCVAAARGWRAMASEATVTKGLNFQMGAPPVWDGREVLVMGSVQPTSCPSGTCPNQIETAAYDPALDRWRLLPNPAITSPYQFASMFTGKSWVLIGTSGPLVAYSFDVATETWTSTKAPLSPGWGVAVTYMASTHEAFVFGGTDGFGLNNAAAAYSDVTHAWRMLPNAPLSPRAGSFATYAGGKVLVAFGFDDPNGDGCCSAIPGTALFDPITNAWTMLDDPPVKPRVANDPKMANALGDGTLASIGFGYSRGFEDPLPPMENDGAMWDVVKSGWTKIPNVGFVDPTRMGFATFVANGKLFVWGGTGEPPPATVNTYYDDGKSFDPGTGTWSTMAMGGPSPRQSAGAVFTGCDAVVYGGSSRTIGKWLPYNDGMLYRP